MPLQQSEKKSLKKDAFALFSGGMGASFFAFIEVVILARFLGLEQFGVFSIVLSFVGIINAVVDLKIANASVKYISDYRERGNKKTVSSFIKFFYIIDFFSGILAFVVCIALANIANQFFIKSENSFQYVFVLSLSLLISTVNQNSYAILRALRRFNQVAFLQTLRNAVRLFLIFMALASGFGLIGFFVAYVLAGFVNFVILQFSVNKTLAQEGMDKWLFADLSNIKDKMREVMWFVSNNAISGFLSFSFSSHIPIILLGYFSGTEASGLYKVAKSVSKVSGKLINPVSQVLYPSMVRLHAKESYRELRNLIIYSVGKIMTFLLPVLIFLFIFAEWIVNLIYGEEYVPAVEAMRIFIVSVGLQGISFPCHQVLLALNKSGIRTLWILTTTLIMFPALLILIPSHSYLGAAYVTLITSVLGVIAAICIFSYTHHLEKKPNQK